MTALFMKIDSSSDGEINWDEFCTYMQLEYAEKEESNFRAKEVSLQEQTSSESASRLHLNIFFVDSEIVLFKRLYGSFSSFIGKILDES